MTSGQEMERVYSYNPGAHMGPSESMINAQTYSNLPAAEHRSYLLQKVWRDETCLQYYDKIFK